MNCSSNSVPLDCRSWRQEALGTPEEFARHIGMGYAAVQLGTRFIASWECTASEAYKQAILDAAENDIVLTERLTGVGVAVIRNAYVDRLGTRAGPFARWMLRGRRRKHWMRTLYTLNSLRRLRKSLSSPDTSRTIGRQEVRRRNSFHIAGRRNRAVLWACGRYAAGARRSFGSAA